MKKLLQILLVLLVLTACNQKVEKPKEEVNEVKSSMIAPSLYSEEMKLDWNYTAYLPSSYDAETKTDFPVLYLMHGAWGNHRNLVERFPIQEQLDRLMSEGKMDEMVVVFIDGFNSFYIDGPGVKMESAIMNDLIPQVEEKLGLNPGRENRYAGGLSMGGYGAANLVLRHPESFSKGILMSPAVWYEMTEETVTYNWHVFRDEKKAFDHVMWEKEHPASQIAAFEEKGLDVSFYVITGKKDEAVSYEIVEKFVEDLKQSEHIKVEAVYDDEGIHAWPFWEKAMEKALTEF